MTDLDLIWRKYASEIPELLTTRPDFRFDPLHYKKQVSAHSYDPSDLMRHYEAHGHAADHTPNLYVQTVSEAPGIDEVLSDIVIDTELAEAMEAGKPGAHELAFELIHLGEPVDAAVSDFSSDSYLRMHADILRAGIDPLVHYLRFGHREKRRILRGIRKDQYSGQLPYRPERPTCLIAVHECSRTGAPIVGRDLAREAAKTHNVIISALRTGPLLEEFRETSCQVLISSLYQDFNLFPGEVLKKIDFAIVNSAVAWKYIPFLVAREIPFAGYLHEYADYLHPAFNFNLFPMFADLLIFSSEHVRDGWRGRMVDVNFDLDRDSTILPQRPFFVGTVSAEKQARAKARLSDLIGRDLSKSRIVCGAGQSQWRKGTDLFAMTAQICQPRDKDTVFIWIGHQIVPDELGFGTYMAYHFKQIGMGSPESNMVFIPAGPAYHDVLTAADVMFLSSRLDPLPNVVFDALEHGCEIVQFDGASGFGDEIYRRSDKFVTVEYGNSEAAATAILALPPKDTSDKATPEKPEFHLFDTIRTRLEAGLKAQRYFVRGASQIDVPILYSSQPDSAEARIREREKMMRYGRRRVWRDLDEVEHEIAASDNWMHSRMRLAPYATAEPEALPPFALHIHAYYTDDLADDLKSFTIYHRARRIVVTTDSEEKSEAIRKIMKAEGLVPEIVLVPNTGRDILPFMNLFQPGGASDRDELWCHLHQKKSIGSTDGGDLWRRFLMRVLLGDAKTLSNAITTLAQDGVGLVAPFDPHFVGWNESRHLLPKFADRLPGPVPDNPLLFPVGNMFWVRRQVVEAMNDLFGPDYPWPDEPIANDGTEYHLIERLWPAMATHLELDQVFVHKLDEQRI